MRTRLGALLAAVVLSLLACDAENVRWAFVSNPGGSFGATGGAVIVIGVSSSSTLGLEGDFVRVEGFQGRSPVSVLLPHVGDFGVLLHSSSVEVRSPVLAFDDGQGMRPGRIEASGAQLQVQPAGSPGALKVQLPDASVVHPAAVGPGTLHIAASGTLMILESGAGVVVFGEQEAPELLGTSVTLTTTPAGDEYALRLSDNRLRFFFFPPLPVPEQRLQYDDGRDSVRILGPLGEVLAELPASAVTLQNGAGGLFLQAELPNGLPGDERPMRLLMAADNRYLLRIDA